MNAENILPRGISCEQAEFTMVAAGCPFSPPPTLAGDITWTCHASRGKMAKNPGEHSLGSLLPGMDMTVDHNLPFQERQIPIFLHLWTIWNHADVTLGGGFWNWT